jgi:LytS/YehU family sensor histidine kinase
MMATQDNIRTGAWLATFVGAFYIPLMILWASPTPWLWTGGRASHAPFFRGLYQSALFNVLLVALIGCIQLGLAACSGIKRGAPGALRDITSAMLLWVPASMLAGYFITLLERTQWVKDETEKKLREAHWVLLRGQLSPHVLFNSLNGLAELVRQDPLAAEQAILDLSALYRALLDHGSRSSAPLGDERKLVERFLAVEQVRLGQRLKVTWDWDESVDSIEAPPFLVQPMVENALKHGIAPSIPGGNLRVSAFRNGKAVLLSVANTGKALPLVLGNGVGVRNLDARLNLAYGAKANFRLRTEEEWTVAEILLEDSTLEEQP